MLLSISFISIKTLVHKIAIAPKIKSQTKFFIPAIILSFQFQVAASQFVPDFQAAHVKFYFPYVHKSKSLLEIIDYRLPHQFTGWIENLLLLEMELIEYTHYQEDNLEVQTDWNNCDVAYK